MHFTTALLALGVAKTAVAGYSVVDDYSGSKFFDMFDFFQGHDPTNGFVNYVDRGTAQQAGLINSNGPAYMGVDSTNQAPNGRSSVRLTSKKSYTHMLTVLDIGNMPGGCGTWPAFWTVGSNWPNGGEIDIIENVNDASTNAMTLHSSSGCSISGGSDGMLQPKSTDCNALANGNQGCSFYDPDSGFYGGGLNANKGAVFAMEWSSSGVSIWRWSKGSAPSDVLADNPNPSNWGKPSAQWAGNGCDWDSKFSAQNLVFDTTFCGDWAGSAFQSCSAAHGGQTCQDFVANNPSAFKDAYWSVNALKVYQTDGKSSSNSSPAPKTPEPEQPVAQPAPAPSPNPPAQPAPAPSPPENQPAPAPSNNGNSGGNKTPLSQSPSGSVGTPADKSASQPQFAGKGSPLLSNEFGSGSHGIPSKRDIDEAAGMRRVRRHLNQHIRHKHEAVRL